MVPGGASSEPPQSKDYRGQIMISRGDALWITYGAGQAGAFPSANRFFEGGGFASRSLDSSA
jgi:hypothetical protein